MSGYVINQLNILLVPALGLLWLLVDLRRRPWLDPLQRRLFSNAAICTLVTICFKVISYATLGKPGVTLHLFSWFCHSILSVSTVLTFSFLAVFLHCGLARDISSLRRLSLMLSTVLTLAVTAVVINTFTGSLFSITTENYLRRGSFHALLGVFSYLLLIYSSCYLTTLFRRSARDSTGIALLLGIGLLIAGLLEHLVPGFELALPSAFVALLVGFIISLCDSAPVPMTAPVSTIGYSYPEYSSFREGAPTRLSDGNFSDQQKGMVKLQANLELRRHALAVRRGILTAVTAAASGHPGGSLSAVEIMILLYFKRMRIRTAEPGWEDRDRFVLSKGHAAPLLYAVLAQRGFLPVSELTTLRQLGSRLQGHPDMHKVPGVDLSTGSLGQGLSAAIGMALGGRLQNRDFRVYALLGDGELQEGQVWEAAMAAAHHKVHNLTAFIDNNGLQIDGSITEVMSPLPIGEKFAAFGWQVLEVDGHDLDALDEACDLAEAETLRPTAIIARTIKGKGVSFMENQPQWHGAAPNAEQLQVALAELEAAEAELALEESLPGGAQDE